MLKHIFESSSALQVAEFIWVPCLGEPGYSLCSSFRGGKGGSADLQWGTDQGLR